ncbi:hypothetical protein PMAYCL1PPCAC_24781, partial [Pristionchus mayeri]
ELDENECSTLKTYKRGSFDMAVKYVPILILADCIEAENDDVIMWYHRLCGSKSADQLVVSILPCIYAYFSTISPFEIKGNHVGEVWRSLWDRLSLLHVADQYSPRYLFDLLGILSSIIKIAKQTPLVDQSWNTVRAVIYRLGKYMEDAKIWQRHRLISFPELLQLLQLLLHQWGFTYRVQLVTVLQPMMKTFANSLEYDKNITEWSLPWSEINKKSSRMEHSWLLMEEYGSIAAPK